MRFDSAAPGGHMNDARRTEIRLDQLRKEFVGGVVACDDLTLTLKAGTTTCLLGPSGCGKTTLMRLIAGLEGPTSGRVFFGERDVTALSTRARNLGMVFQYPVVYQGTTIRENVAMPLKHEPLTTAQRAGRVDEVLGRLGLDMIADHSVARLDNATRQKVAVARAIARSAPVVLFDEPITNVDISAKLHLKRVLKELFSHLDQTVIYVTHDQTEAMTLADNIALMKDGRVEQLATPRELYSASASVFAGWFLGHPGMNFVRVSERPRLVGEVFGDGLPHDAVTVGFRPEDVMVRTEPTSGWASATVEHVALTTGGQHLATLRCDGQIIKAKLPSSQPHTIAGTEVWWRVSFEKVRAFDQSERLVAS
jgi:ABC-type sugar transport system ATPase subunit